MTEERGQYIRFENPNFKAVDNAAAVLILELYQLSLTLTNLGDSHFDSFLVLCRKLKEAFDGWSDAARASGVTLQIVRD